MKYDREILRLSDGGTIALDWHIDESGGKPSVIDNDSTLGMLS